MATPKLQIPNGMQDTLPGECRARRELEERFRRLFQLSGYREIETPILEYYDVLSDKTYGYRPEHVWKTFDSFGHVLAIRPDSTIPCARLAAGALRGWPLPLRLFYTQSASNYQSDTLSMLCEQPQAGLELMGEDAAAADAEAISLAVSCLESAGLREYQIELGHAAFFAGFMQEAGLEEDQIREIRTLLEHKDALGMQLYLRSIRMNEQVAQRLIRLPRLYGGPEILDEAAALTEHPVCREALHRLRTVIALLEDFGCSADVTIDLGMAQEASYYSGIIFRGHAAGVGQPILSGGRYDGLTKRFGRALPAVGFAMMTKLLMIALERQGDSFENPVPDYLVAGGPDSLRQVLSCVQRLRAEGQCAVPLYQESAESLEKRLRDGQARHAVWVEASGVSRELEVCS